MLTALGAAFFLLGVRFALLRWRELDLAERRIERAVQEAEREIRTGVSVISPAASPVMLAHQIETSTDDRVVQARSDPPGPMP